ncbi:MAG: inorganic pyrophosphatase Ppa [Deltaproteobacteria bacterium]|nr:inorganic pyrophosphatase Ppa [Deltaproteobacteria bacterium]
MDHPLDILPLIPRRQLEVYRGNTEKLEALAVAFTGSPRQHPSDPSKVLLRSDPMSHQGFFYEFLVKDLMYAEELPSLAAPRGDMVPMVRLWVKKGAVGLRVAPFQVADTRGGWDGLL